MNQDEKNKLIDILSAFSHILDDMDTQFNEISSEVSGYSASRSLYKDIQSVRSQILEFQKTVTAV